MTTSSTVIIKTSPIVFIKRLVLFELLTTIVFFLLRYLTIVEIINSEITAVGIFSSTIMSILLLTGLQVLVISTILLTWYSEKYLVSKSTIVYKWNDFFQDRELVHLSDVKSISLREGRLSRFFNYGSLTMQLKTKKKVTLKHVPNPQKYKRILLDRVENGSHTNLPIIVDSIPALIKSGENQTVEFKSSFQWDYRQKKKNKDLHKAAMKNLVAFMNSSGGVLLVGVDDEGKILGLKDDFSLLQKKNSDDFENVFNMAFKKMIGDEFRHFIDISFKTIKKKKIAIIVVQPANRPAYLQFKGEEEFYIRTGNSSQPLSLRKATLYIQSRFASI